MYGVELFMIITFLLDVPVGKVLYSQYIEEEIFWVLNHLRFDVYIGYLEGVCLVVIGDYGLDLFCHELLKNEIGHIFIKINML